jgi:hypothetical protein
MVNADSTQSPDHFDLMREAAAEFPQIQFQAKILTMRVWHCKYKSLRAIGAFQNLEELVIATFPDSSLDVLASLKKLRYLRILHMPKITDLRALPSLRKLESLSLATSPSWDASGKCIVVESLDPIAEVVCLKHLELFGVCPPYKSLSSIESLKRLESARFSRYPEEEIARFYKATGVTDQFNPKPSFEIA